MKFLSLLLVSLALTTQAFAEDNDVAPGENTGCVFSGQGTFRQDEDGFHSESDAMNAATVRAQIKCKEAGWKDCSDGFDFNLTASQASAKVKSQYCLELYQNDNIDENQEIAMIDGNYIIKDPKSFWKRRSDAHKVVKELFQ